MTEHKEKNKILGIRIDEDLFDIFDKFCQDRKLSKSEVARKAIMMYIHIIFDPDRNPKFIFSKSQFKYCLSCLSTVEISELARISVQNGLEDMQKLKTVVPPSYLGDPRLNTFDFQLKTLIHFVFSPEGQNWFTEVNYERDGNNFTFHGCHTFGFPFSIYISHLLTQYATPVGYHLLSETFHRDYQDDREMFIVDLRFSL